MKLVCLFMLSLVQAVASFAQSAVFDVQYFQSIVSNGAVRGSAEISHDQYLGQIRTNIDNINTDMASVVLAQTIIYNSLSNVNSALKNGLEFKNMAVIVADMTGYINQALQLARSEPYLLLFANKISAEMRERGLLLVKDVSNFVLKSGSNVLADYNARDELLRKVSQQLRILNALAYGAWKAMYWAKQKGIIASVNPFTDYIDRDKEIVRQIITNAKYLRQ